MKANRSLPFEAGHNTISVQSQNLLKKIRTRTALLCSCYERGYNAKIDATPGYTTREQLVLYNVALNVIDFTKHNE